MLSWFGFVASRRSPYESIPTPGSLVIAMTVIRIAPPSRMTVWIVSVTTTARRPPTTV